MIGGYRVAQQRQHAGPANVVDAFRLHRHVLEIRRVLDVGGFPVPRIGLARRHLQTVPVFVAVEDSGVTGGEHARIDILGDQVLNLPGTGPDVTQVYGIAVLILAQRVAIKVGRHVAGQGVCDHKGRGGQEVHANQLVDSAFEVSITRQYRTADQIGGLNRLGDVGGQGTGITDAGGTAEADDIESECLQVIQQFGFCQVFGDHP